MLMPQQYRAPTTDWQRLSQQGCYKPSQMLTASLNRQVKVTLRFNEVSKDYRGAAAGMQFQSTGPTEIATTRSRR